METDARYTLIGALTLAVIAGIFGFILWFSGGEQQSAKKHYRIIFTSSVSGLARGAYVTFNGLRVGEVTDLNFGDDPSKVTAAIEVIRQTPVKNDTRARLEYQGLTGVASVALLGGSLDAPILQGENVPIFAERSEYQNILETFQRLSNKADSILEKTDDLLGKNTQAINNSFENVEKFTRSLGDNASGIQDALAGLADLGKTLKPLSARLEVLAGSLDNLVKAVNPQDVKKIVSNAASFSDTLVGQQAHIDLLMKNSVDISAHFLVTSEKLETLVNSATGVVKAVEPTKIQAILDNTSKFSETLEKNRPEMDAIFKHTQNITAQLEDASRKVDSVLKAAEGLLSQPGSKGAFEQVGDAAASIKKLADNLDKRSKDIADGIVKFTNSGLQDYRGLANDGRHTLDELNRTLNSLQKNPQQIIFGPKTSIPEYEPR